MQQKQQKALMASFSCRPGRMGPNQQPPGLAGLEKSPRRKSY